MAKSWALTFSLVLFSVLCVTASSDAIDAIDATMAGQPVYDNLCGFNLYNQTQWIESGSGIRLQQMFMDYQSVKPDLEDKNFITGFFMPKYLPGSSIVGGTCNVLQQCNVSAAPTQILRGLT
jgi:hypothetical protein